MVAKYISGLRALMVRRVVTMMVAVFVTTAFVVILIRIGPNNPLPAIDVSKITGLDSLIGDNAVDFGRCDIRNQTGALERWMEARNKYDTLMGDKFTIALQTYKRPKELDDTLRVLLTEKIPSLHEVVIVWNNLEETPPDNFKSEHGVPVRYRVSERNSLNMKLWPDPDFQTKAVLLSDDDVYYKPQDLEFVFQTWRKFGKFRLTGALPRCATEGDDGKWGYGFCSKDAKEDVYSMIITNLCFTHMSFLEYYSSDDPTMEKIRKYVDKNLNCEDIALNYVASLLTGSGPLLVQGREKYVNYEPEEGISKKPGHLEARSKCLNDFTEIFGCMPLVNETAHIERGVIVL